jgi:hypothetical protein
MGLPPVARALPESPMSLTARQLLVPSALVLLGGCAPLNPGVPGTPDVTHPAIDGTVFTIVFENENADDILIPAHPTFYSLAHTQGRADAYVSYDHPSLTNYLVMTSGTTHGFTSSEDPLVNPAQIEGNDNLPAQLDAAGIPWRAYMESMGEPCRLDSTGLYGANHNPFVYYQSLRTDVEHCREHVVDFDEHFDADLAANTHRYMFITPNRCSDMHDCPIETGDAWLADILPRIMASEGYRNNGVIFILFDEGYMRWGGAGANVATLVLSPQLVSPNYTTNTRFDHRSYLATVQDIFGLPRLPTTETATPMGEFFVSRPEPTLTVTP